MSIVCTEKVVIKEKEYSKNNTATAETLTDKNIFSAFKAQRQGDRIWNIGYKSHNA